VAGPLKDVPACLHLAELVLAEQDVVSPVLESVRLCLQLVGLVLARWPQEARPDLLVAHCHGC